MQKCETNYLKTKIMSEEVIDSSADAGAKERPSFLTVLCILTFVGSGLGVLGGLLGLIGSSALSAFVTQGSMAVQVMGLAAAVLCLVGAIQMWGLKKQGFALYAAGVAVSIIGGIVSALTFSSTMSAVSNMAPVSEMSSEMYAASDVMSGAVWTGAIIGIAINVAFLLMYNSNKKHLVN